MDIDTLESKWLSFGWHVQRIDGHDITIIDDAVQRAKTVTDRPSMIILDTIKGKGCSFAENLLGSHNMPMGKEQLEEALTALGVAPSSQGDN